MNENERSCLRTFGLNLRRRERLREIGGDVVEPSKSRILDNEINPE